MVKEKIRISEARSKRKVDRFEKFGGLAQEKKLDDENENVKIKRKRTGTKKSKKNKLLQIKKDLSQECEAYLHSWAFRLTEDWKFNKNLQNWLVENCFQIDIFDEKLFLLFSPYIESIRGAVIERLYEKCNSIIGDVNSNSNAQNRATVVQQIIIRNNPV